MSADATAVCPRCYPDADPYDEDIDDWDLREYWDIGILGKKYNVGIELHCRTCGYLVQLHHAFELPGLEVVIDEKDLRIDVYTHGLNGWIIRMTHIPTGIMLTADDSGHSSQLQGKVTLLNELKTKLRGNPNAQT